MGAVEDDFLSEAIADGVDSLADAADFFDELLRQLAKLRASIRKIARDRDLTRFAGKRFRDQVEATIREIKSEVSAFFEDRRLELEQRYEEVALLLAASLSERFSRYFRTEEAELGKFEALTVSGMTPTEFLAAASARTGGLLAADVRAWAAAANREERQLLGSLASSSNPAYAAAYNSLSAAARTLSIAAVNAAALRVYKKNPNLVRAVEAVAVLDDRTSDICISRDGRQWDIATGEQVGGEGREDFPGPPPWHPRCRSILVPLFVAAADLKKSGKDINRLRSLLPQEVLDKMDGTAPRRVKYAEWFGKQSPERQRSILGNSRYELWAAGKLPLYRLSEVAGRRLQRGTGK